MPIYQKELILNQPKYSNKHYSKSNFRAAHRIYWISFVRKTVKLTIWSNIKNWWVAIFLKSLVSLNFSIVHLNYSLVRIGMKRNSIQQVVALQFIMCCFNFMLNVLNELKFMGSITSDKHQLLFRMVQELTAIVEASVEFVTSTSHLLKYYHIMQSFMNIDFWPLFFGSFHWFHTVCHVVPIWVLFENFKRLLSHILALSSFKKLDSSPSATIPFRKLQYLFHFASLSISFSIIHSCTQTHSIKLKRLWLWCSIN